MLSSKIRNVLLTVGLRRKAKGGLEPVLVEHGLQAPGVFGHLESAHHATHGDEDLRGKDAHPLQGQADDEGAAINEGGLGHIRVVTGVGVAVGGDRSLDVRLD